MIDCKNTALELTTKLLANASEPEWLALSSNMQKVVEYLLWDCYKDGLASHLAGASPCIFVDLDRLLALIYKALGSFILLYHYVMMHH